MSNDTTILDLDSMLDTAMDSVKTLPDYVNPPSGTYIINISDCLVEKYDWPAKNGKPAQKGQRIKIQYEVNKTLDLSDEKELAVKEGSLFSETFMATEDGLAYFKKAAMNILNVTDFSGATVKDIMDGLKGQMFKARITYRKSKGADGTVYENLQIRAVHEAA